MVGKGGGGVGWGVGGGGGGGGGGCGGGGGGGWGGGVWGGVGGRGCGGGGTPDGSGKEKEQRGPGFLYPDEVEVAAGVGGQGVASRGAGLDTLGTCKQGKRASFGEKEKCKE